MFSKKVWMVVVISAALILAAGGIYWFKKHPASSLVGGDTVATNPVFEVQACSARLHEDKPALALMLSDRIDSSQNLEQLIQVSDLGAPAREGKEAKADAPTSVKAAWLVADNPRVIVFPNVKPGHLYKIELAAGIASASGRKLEAQHSCEVQADEMAPSFFFASKGSLLTANLNGGLPVVTVNIPEVDVEFLRIQEDKLPKFFDMVAGKRPRDNDSSDNADAGEGEGEGNDYYDYYHERNRFKGQTSGWQLNSLQKLSHSVYQNRFLTSELNNARKTTFLPVEKIKELQEPGIYVAVMRRPGVFDNDYQVTYFFVTDIGLHVRRQLKHTDVFTTSLKTGKALGGVEINALDNNGKPLVHGKTDGDGHAQMTGLPDSAKILLARRGKEISVVSLQEPGLDLAEFDIGGHLPRDAKLFAYAGRDLYRPGEKFTVSVLARNADGSALPPAPLKVTLKKPGGEVYNTAVWQPQTKTPGYLQQDIELPADAATGKWSLEFRADPHAKQADTLYGFQVEEFLPERMKLTLQSDTKVLQKDDTFSVAVQGDYLYGAPAAGNRLLGSVASERAPIPFGKEWPGFIVGDFNDDANKKRSEIEETALDDAGKGEVDVPFESGANSVMKVRASFSLLESGGRPVVRSIERQWWPAPAMIAVRPLFDSHVSRENALAEFELVRLDSAAKIQGIAQAPYRLVREDRQYYWRYESGRGWHSGYSEAEETVHSGALSLQKRAKLSLPVGWGRYRLETTDPETQITSQYRFYAGWNAQDADSMGNRPDRVKLQLENVPAQPGQDMHVTITPPHDGEALVLVEADKVLWSQRVAVSVEGTRVSIPVHKDWKRADMYVSTIVYRPASQGDKVTPARAVGLSWLPLAHEAQKLKVAIQAPNQVEPEKRVTAKIKVDGMAGQNAMVTLSAVDVGILNITDFKTPDAFDFFFGKHRFSAELTDVYGKLIERMDGTPGKIKWGGDAGKRDTRSMPKKVKLVDLFSGPVPLDAKGEAEIPLTIPDFNGTLRLMAVASTSSAYGRAEKEMLVTAPIVAEIALPRFIGPGDNSLIALDVTNMLPKEQDIQIKIGSDRLLKFSEPERSIKLKNKQRHILRFAMEPTEAYGLARITVDVKTPGVTPIHREFALQIQPSVPREQDSRRLRIDAGASQKLDASMVERYFKGSSTLSVTLSNKPPLNIKSIVKGLLDYPYGCLEQTTSAAYPHVFIDEASAKALGLEPRSREQRARFIEGAIARIAGMQASNGGYRLWSADSGDYETWLTPYVAAFLMDAKDAGFNVPDDMNKRAGNWMLEKLQAAANQFPSIPSGIKPKADGNYDWRDHEFLRNSHQRFAEFAHIGYMLAREQKAPLAALRLLHDQYRDRARSPLPLVHLAIALQLMGDAKRSEQALNDAMGKPYGIHANYDWEWMGDYGSGLRDYALAYALLYKHQVPHAQRENFLQQVSAQLSRNRYYYSTQERIALFLAARAAGLSAAESWSAQLTSSDTNQTYSSKDSQTISLNPALAAKGITLENKGTGVLWAEVESSGFPLKPPTATADRMTLERRWFTTDGKPWNGGTLKVGDMVLVRITAKAKQTINDGLIVDPVPAGLEVENQNLSQGPQAQEFSIEGVNLAQAMNDSRIKHREFRDDRFVVAAKIDGSPLQLFYMLRVVTPGKYAVPGTYAEDMYRPEIRSYLPASEAITIQDPRAAK